MTESSLSRIRYVADGVATDFAFPFPILRPEELAVSLDGTDHASGFTIEGAGDPAGGTIRFDIAPAAGTVVALRREVPVAAATEFHPGGDLRARSLNDAFDRQIAIDRQLADALARTIRVPAHEEPAGLDLPDRATRANRALVFDADGNLALGAVGQVVSPFGPFQPAMEGIVPREVHAKLADALSVRDFGAAGDGVADDTGAFRAALAAARAVFAPPGIYRITGTLTLTEGRTLAGAGDGTELRMEADAPLVEIVAGYAALERMRLVGGTVGVLLHGAEGPCVQNVLRDLSIWDATRGIVLDGKDDPAWPCYWNAVQRVLVARPSLHGVHLTRTGAGDTPNANKFHDVRVYSLSAPIAGSGFFVEAGGHMNVFNECEANVSTDAEACFRLGPGASKTEILNLYTESLGLVPNVLIDEGAGETTIVNLHSASAGAAIDDRSDGGTLTLNAGFPVKNRLGRAQVDELEAPLAMLGELVRETRFTEGVSDYQVDMAARLHLVSAFGGPVTATLPAPAAAPGRQVTVKKTDPSANAVAIVDADGGNPDGQPFSLQGQGHSVGLMSNGGSWWITDRHP